MSKKKLVYIAGAVTGENLEKVRERFAKKEAELKEKGYRVHNPVALVDLHGYQGLPDRQIMQFLIPFLVVADQLYILQGWQYSKGTNIERDLCRSLGTEIVYE